MIQSNLLDPFIKTVLSRNERHLPVSDQQAMFLNTIVESFDAAANKLLEIYNKDIDSRRISLVDQQVIAESFLRDHGHSCSNYKSSFIRKVYWYMIINPQTAQLNAGKIIAVYSRCHAHREILDKIAPRFKPMELIKKFELEYADNETPFAKFLSTIDPSANTSTWRKRIQRFRKAQLKRLKNGTTLQ